MTRPYGVNHDAERFSFSMFLVLSNRLVSLMFSLVVLALRRKSVTPNAPIVAYAGVSISNVIAAACQYEALKYLSIPLQTLGKCAKMVPALIWGSIVNKRNYHVADYVVALGVMSGCTLFALCDRGTMREKSSSGNFYGIALMICYLGFDGFTTTFQEKLFKGYRIETFNQVFWVNFCSIVISSFCLFLDSSMGEAIKFVLSHRESLTDILVLSTAASCGQLCILYTIREYGALLLATIMTTRQFLSILLSCIIYLHPLSELQWVGTILVFVSLHYQISMKRSSPGQKPLTTVLLNPSASAETLSHASAAHVEALNRLERGAFRHE